VITVKKILLAIDGSDHSKRAISVGAEMAQALSAEILVFHQREHKVAPRLSVDVEDPKDASALVDTAVEEIRGAGVASVEGRVDVGILGREANAILDVAKQQGAEMIVMGTRGLSELSGLLLGSVTNKVIHLADCPVLTVR
jgi:nucleotide-binding universal stress UspA family protein